MIISLMLSMVSGPTEFGQATRDGKHSWRCYFTTGSRISPEWLSTPKP
jgi:hypothetical protein